MQTPKPHYAEVPRKDPLHNFDVKQKIVPIDLEREHARKNKLDYLTLRLKFGIPIIFIFVSFALILIMLLLSVTRPSGDIIPAIGVLETISYISESNPVVDIRPITGSQLCDQGAFEPGSLGTWRSTDRGCYCPSRNVFERRECAPSEAGTCQFITRQPEIETFTWNGDRFCVRRLFNFIRTAGACPSGFTKCGDMFCTPSGENCPITDVQVLAETVSTPAGYSERAMTFERKIVFTNSASSNKQLVQFTANAQVPCLNNNAFSERTTGKTHLLEFEAHTGCHEYGADTESVALDTRSESDFNLFNNIKKITEANVPLYDSMIAGSVVTLTARYRFVTIKDDTCAQYYVSNIPQLVKDVEDFAYLYRGITIAGIVMSSITSIIALVYFKVITRDGIWMLNREEPFGRRFLYQIVCLHTLYAVVTTILGNIALAKVNAQESYIKDLEGPDCFANQPLLNKAMDVFATYLTNKIDGLVFLNNILVFVSGGVLIAVTIIILIRKQRKYDGSFSGQH